MVRSRSYKHLEVSFQGKPFNTTITQVYAPTTDAKEAEVDWFYEDLQHFLELTPKRCLYHHRGLECKSRSQKSPRITDKFDFGVQNEAGKRLIEFCQENMLVIASTLLEQPKRWLYTWTSPDGQYWNQIDYVYCSWRWRSSTQSAKARPEADCGSNQQFLIAKFRL